jgi:hypothetical protein
MQDRKKLNLNEVLNLDRRPTLQEMVDLSIEDYTKYLYQKGIIPEGFEIRFNEDDNWIDDGTYDYDPDGDIVFKLKNGTINDNGGTFSCDFYKNKPLIESSIDNVNKNLNECNLPVQSSDGRTFYYTYSEDSGFYYMDQEE